MINNAVTEYESEYESEADNDTIGVSNVQATQM